MTIIIVCKDVFYMINKCNTSANTITLSVLAEVL